MSMLGVKISDPMYPTSALPEIGPSCEGEEGCKI